MRAGISTILGAVLALIAGAWFVAEAQTITRGPYLQQTTDSGAILRWRTNVATDSEVRYGAAAGSLSSTASSGALTTDHEIGLSGLSADTKYYYSVGDAATVLAGDDANHYFTTSPTPGTAVPTRIWVLGDSGTANAGARAVRDAYEAYTGGADTDILLMLGDNAYPDGTDGQYQAAVFDTYPNTLRNVALWPTLGNHDGHTADSATQTGAYYDIFSLPKNAEAGGVASGTEAYYSFDYGNIHFISLESYETDRSPAGAMMTWLDADLMANELAGDKDWIVAIWHHPPFTKGSHDSDTEGRLIDMRQNALPILESYGVDLVLGGHSHAYERSMFLDGHYGVSSTLAPSMILDDSAGRDSDLGPYEKDLGSVFSGAVYAVAGSSGKIGGGSLDHPAMYLSLNELGSMVLEVDGLRLDATFLNSGGSERDTFSIVKGQDISPPFLNTAEATDANTVVATFSEVVDEISAETPTNYTLDNGATVASATLQTDGRFVTLTTSALTEGVTYTLGVANVEDLAGNPIAAGAEAAFVYTALHTLSFQNGVAPDSLYTGAVDTHLSQTAPTTNYGGATRLLVDGSDPSGNDLSTLMAWDVSDIPSNATVVGATIVINVTDVSSGPYDLSALVSSWQEGSATWNERGVGVPWATAGANGAADRSSTTLGAATGSVTGPHSIALNADGLAVLQGWVDGGLANNGVIMANGAVANGLDFKSREDLSLNDRPKLTVTYTLPTSGGDTEPPLAPSDLAAGAVTETSVALTWSPCADYPTTVCDNVGVTGYSVYRDGAMAGSSATPDFTDIGLTPDTAYDYDVAAFDAAGNTSPRSPALTVTTDPAPVVSVLVNDISMALRPVGRKKRAAVAVITIVDGDAVPAAGASVSGAWSGLVGGSATGLTLADGTLSVESARVANTASGQFIFTVTNVTLAGHAYDPAGNVETGDCIDTDGQQCSGDPGNFAPMASFTSPASCAVDTPCVFTDTSSDADGTVTGWSWNFGDGGTSSVQSPSHTYSCPAGVYAVSLTATDDGGASDGATGDVTVTGDCPTGPVSLSEISSAGSGGTWSTTIRVTLDGGGTGVVEGAWSGGVSASAGCTASGGVCDITSPAIRKKNGSVTYTATMLDGVAISPAVSLTVQKP